MDQAWRTLCLLAATTVCLLVKDAAGQTFVEISSLSELFALQAVSDHDVTLAGGVYTLDLASKTTVFGGTWPAESPGQSGLFNFSGSNNVWRFRSVTIEFNTEVLGDLPDLADSSLVAFGGSDNVFEDLTWEHQPASNGVFGSFVNEAGGSVFVHTGSNNVVSWLTLRSGGGTPYGFGAILGTAGNAFPGLTLSALSAYVFSDATDAVLQDSIVDHSGLGDVVAFKGASSVHIEKCEIIGETRSTASLRADPVLFTDRNNVSANVDYDGTVHSGVLSNNVAFLTNYFIPTELDACQNLDGSAQVPDIRTGRQFSLVEDGLRSYGSDIELTVRNTRVTGTRSGLRHSESGLVSTLEGVTFRGLAGHGVPSCDGASNSGTPDFDAASVQPGSSSVATFVKADATYIPALDIGGLSCSDVVNTAIVDMEILDPEVGSTYARPDGDALAYINGDYNRVRLEKPDLVALGIPLNIQVGNCAASASNLICNLTPQPVTLSAQTSFTVVYSVGTVTDLGTDNTVTQLTTGDPEPDVCKIVRRGEFQSATEDVEYDKQFALTRGSAGHTSNCGWWGCRVGFMSSSTFELDFFHGRVEPTFFFVRPEPGVTPATACVQWGDTVALALSTEPDGSGGCGFYGCRVARVVGTSVEFDQGSGLQNFIVRPRFGVVATGCVQTSEEVFFAVTTDAGDTAGCGPYGCQVAYLDPSARTAVVGTGTAAMANSGMTLRNWAVALGPTQAPTASPSRAPTARPTLSPTASPTTSPTLSPTVSPTLSPTLSPTQSPTKASCSLGDVQVWIFGGSDALDAEVLACAIDECVLDTVTNPSDPSIEACMYPCMELEGDSYTPGCTSCMADFGICMKRECACPAGRGESPACDACASAQCEVPFTVCTGRNLEIPDFVAPAGGDGDGDGDGDGGVGTAGNEDDGSAVVVIGASAGGGALLLGLLVALVVVGGKRRRGSGTGEGKGKEVPLYGGVGGPLSTKMGSSDSVESGNPSFDETDSEAQLMGAAAAAARFGALGPAPPASARFAASQAAPHADVFATQQAAVFEVKHQFVAEFDDELSCDVGDVLVGIKPVGNDGEWWFCKNPKTGQDGMVPTQNLEMH